MASRPARYAPPPFETPEWTFELIAGTVPAFPPDKHGHPPREVSRPCTGPYRSGNNILILVN